VTVSEGHGGKDVDVAIGVSGLEALLDYRGQKDTYGYEMRRHWWRLQTNWPRPGSSFWEKTRRIPVAIVRGFGFKGTGEKEAN